MQPAPETWWSREAGGRDVFRLALPLVLSTASWAVMHFVDRLFLLWHSPTEMGAALPAGNLLWTVMALPLGIASYAHTFVAQYHGAGQPRRIGVVMRHGVGFGWVVAPMFLALVPLAPLGFRWLGHDAELARQWWVQFRVPICRIRLASVESTVGAANRSPPRHSFLPELSPTGLA